LDQAKQIIENQRLEIQKLKEEHEKADAKYSTILAMMNDRLQEQDSEAVTMKHEISNMIKQQQQHHTIEMQELYDRMMRQMSNMLNLQTQPLPFEHLERHNQDSAIHSSASDSNNCSEHQDKKTGYPSFSNEEKAHRLYRH
jgi:F0F1-type ATP synthase membrane subunit b/b'